ncbi:MAG: DUF2497 domain-containing protein [Pseudomonadota bacterium]
MSNGNVVDEPSMDEILSSIRKIIAEDEVEDRAAAPQARKAKADEAAALDLTEDDVGDAPFDGDADDVLELTADDETAPMDADDDEAAPAEMGFANADEPADLLVEDDPNVEDASAAADEGDEPGTAPAVAVGEAADADQVSAQPSDKAAVVMDATTEVLLDSGAASMASGALQRLSAAMAPGDALAGGNRSIETFLADLVRPELKAWLDTNLPPLVERIVEREIKKLVRDAQPD